MKLENCVENELFMVETIDDSSVYFYSGNQKGAQGYIDNGFKVRKEGKIVVRKLNARILMELISR